MAEDNKSLNSKNGGYDESSIVAPEQATVIRERPSQIMGTDGIEGARHQLTEINGNATDEALSGYGTKIRLGYSEKTNVLLVEDFGRGVPMGWNPKVEKFNWHLNYNNLYSSAKYDDNQEQLKAVTNWDKFDPKSISYLFSIGLNGVGGTATQYTSRFMTVVSTREHKVSMIHCYKGFPILPVENIYDAFTENDIKMTEDVIALVDTYKNNLTKEEVEDILYNDITKQVNLTSYLETEDYISFTPEIVRAFRRIGFEVYLTEPFSYEDPNKEQGTMVIWTPDDEVYNNTYIGRDWVVSLQDSIRNVNRIALDFILFDKEGVLNEEEYAASDLMSLLGKDVNPDKVIEIHKVGHGVLTEKKKEVIYVVETNILMNFIVDPEKEENPTKKAFINTVPVKDGNLHSKLISAFYQFAKSIITENPIFIGDIIPHVSFVVSSYSNILSLHGQTKDDVNNPHIIDPIYELVYEKLKVEYSQGNHDLTKIIHSIEEEARVREEIKKSIEQFKKAKKVANKRQTKNSFNSCIAYDNGAYDKVELFVAEGDSAGKAIVNTREKHYQAVYFLTGKFNNFLKKTTDKLLQTDVFLDLLNICGIEMDVDSRGEIRFDISNMKVGKLIMTTDADVDGSQIRVLIFNMFYRFRDLRPLLEEGWLQIALPPLYRIDTSAKGTLYALNDEEKDIIVQEENVTYIERYKGLGSVSANILRVTTVHPDTRRTLPIYYKSNAEVDFIINTLFGSDMGKNRKSFVLNMLGENSNTTEKEIKKEMKNIDNETEDDIYEILDVEI